MSTKALIPPCVGLRYLMICFVLCCLFALATSPCYGAGEASVNKISGLSTYHPGYLWAGSVVVAFICLQSMIVFWLSRSLIRRNRAEKQQNELAIQHLHSQKMVAIATFAGGFAHDLNNIIGAISNCGELALEDTPPESPVREDLRHILKASKRGKELIRQILNFSRKSKQVKQLVKVNDIIEECFRHLQHTFLDDVEITLHILSKDCVILADSCQIHLVLTNLCTNAEQAMGGTQRELSITLERVFIGGGSDLLSQGQKEGDYACISVADTGAGIPKEIQSRIFEPFFTTRPKGEGAGLGLAVVYGIITGEGGTIRVESEDGKGSVLKIYLPCRTDDDRTKADNTDRAGVKHESTERVLLVDDDEFQLYSHRKMLEGLGYKVTALALSDRAISIFEAAPDDFDLVITDQIMPKVTGLELAQRVKKCRPGTAVILCSAMSDDDHGFPPGALAEAGVHSFVEKPFGITDISIKIRSALDYGKTKEMGGWA